MEIDLSTEPTTVYEISLKMSVEEYLCLTGVMTYKFIEGQVLAVIILTTIIALTYHTSASPPVDPEKAPVSTTGPHDCLLDSGSDVVDARPIPAPVASTSSNHTQHTVPLIGSSGHSTVTASVSTYTDTESLSDTISQLELHALILRERLSQMERELRDTLKAYGHKSRHYKELDVKYERILKDLMSAEMQLSMAHKNEDYLMNDIQALRLLVDMLRVENLELRAPDDERLGGMAAIGPESPEYDTRIQALESQNRWLRDQLRDREQVITKLQAQLQELMSHESDTELNSLSLECEISTGANDPSPRLDSLILEAYGTTTGRDIPPSPVPTIVESANEGTGSPVTDDDNGFIDSDIYYDGFDLLYGL
ncbi:unnamed protein product [Oppiella nova]|uniref:Uncharacterized protein n=1 Tax=Oppiella nova TaxID=334625 RepID=A0A7R9M0R3_9ACAR|nr:unnamed protein product [Oppiella nova]CAG2168711.1 unnamed protein product [Oppiella nova]